MIPGRHLDFLNGRPECIYSAISQKIFTTKGRKWAHIYFVIYRYICNLVPITTDMVSGRHLELKTMATVKITKLP